MTSTVPLPDLLYLSRGDVESLDVPFEDVVAMVRRVYREKGEGRLESPPKRGVSPAPGCSIRAMKAFVPSLQAAGVKWISAFPGNVERGWPTINALMVLNDVETGLPTAVLDGSWITGVRTAAATLVAAQHMARPESRSAGILACGLQGRMNLRALCSSFPIRTVKAFDLDAGRAHGFADEMGDELGVDVQVVGTPQDTAADVDVFVSSLPIVRRPSPPIGPGVLSAGTFAALLDYNSALEPAALTEADKLIVDDQAQLRFFRSIGYFRGTPEPDGDLGKVVAGRQRGRDDDGQIVVALNLGIGVLDVAVGTVVVALAREAGCGTTLPL